MGLILTFFLWLYAGCPDNTPSEPTPAEKARIEAPFRQFEQWEREDQARSQRRHKRAPRRDLLDAQKRVHAADDEIDHAEP